MIKSNKKRLSAIFAAILVVLVVFVIVQELRSASREDRNQGISTPTIDVALSVTETLGVILERTKSAVPVITEKIPPTLIPASPTPFIMPDSFYIMGINGTGQYFALGCEASAAVDWAKYFGVEIYEYNFQKELPLSDNPDLGFVGDAKGPWGQVPPYAYGVHAEPVAELLRKYGLDAIGAKGLTLDQVKESIARSGPVIAWVIGNMVGGVPSEYTDEKGNKTIVAAYEHVVILTGFNEDSIRYMNNGRFFEVPNEVFLNSWGVLGNMAVFHE